ncbi:serine hydrolase [Candidatus Daviesbacteria bacterium]|nr:serine hydrolase [Candidatus Daviesbacteria bacterium]
MSNIVIPGIRLKPQKRKRKLPVILIFLLFMTSIFVYGIFNQSVKKELINPLLGIEAETSLNRLIQYSLAGTKDTYGITIKSLKTGETYSYNDHRVFDTGSLYKLWVMAATIKQIEEGILTEELSLNGSIGDLNKKFNIDSASAELTTGSINMTVASAINQMITISHNYAALLLTEKIKLSTVAKFLKENGFQESSVGITGEAPKSTSADISLFLEKLYKGELASKENTEKMINILKKQQLNGGLQKYLPAGVAAHKTGDLGWFKHDAGIVFTQKGDYVISILSESGSPLGAQEKIALISKIVYDYFTK